MFITWQLLSDWRIYGRNRPLRLSYDPEPSQDQPSFLRFLKDAQTYKAFTKWL